MRKKLLSIILSLAMLVTIMPMQTVDVAAKVKTKATVSTQKGLKKALKNKKLKTLTIKTSKKVKFAIPKGVHKKLTLVVNAPKADVTNKARFKKITVKKIASKTWKEYAKDNSLTIDALTGHFSLLKSANVKSVKITKENSKVTFDVKGKLQKTSIESKANVTINNAGTIGTINVNQKSSLNITGETKSPIKVNIFEGADDTIITSSVKLEIITDSRAEINLAKGAEDTTVKLNQDKQVVIKNETNKDVKVNNYDEKEQVVKNKEEVTINGEEKKEEKTEEPTPGPTPDPINPGVSCTCDARLFYVTSSISEGSTRGYMYSYESKYNRFVPAGDDVEYATDYIPSAEAGKWYHYEDGVVHECPNIKAHNVYAGIKIGVLGSPESADYKVTFSKDYQYPGFTYDSRMVYVPMNSKFTIQQLDEKTILLTCNGNTITLKTQDLEYEKQESYIDGFKESQMVEMMDGLAKYDGTVEKFSNTMVYIEGKPQTILKLTEVSSSAYEEYATVNECKYDEYTYSHGKYYLTAQNKDGLYFLQNNWDGAVSIGDYFSPYELYDDPSKFDNVKKVRCPGILTFVNDTIPLYTIELSSNGGYQEDELTSVQIAKNATGSTRIWMSEQPIPDSDELYFDGWYSEASGGAKVLYPDGTCVKNVAGFTNTNGEWIKTNSDTPQVTLYAQYKTRAAYGDIIELKDGRTFRIIRDFELGRVKLVAMSGEKMPYNSSSKTAVANYSCFGDEKGNLDVQKYDGSTIDTYLNTTYYDGLPEDLQGAIIKESCNGVNKDFNILVNKESTAGATDLFDLTDKSYNVGFDTPTECTVYYSGMMTNTNQYAISTLRIDDIEDYIGDEVSSYKINNMLFRTNKSQDEEIWFASAYAGDPSKVWYYNGNSGAFEVDSCTASKVVRPVLDVDLAKFEWEKVASGTYSVTYENKCGGTFTEETPELFSDIVYEDIAVSNMTSENAAFFGWTAEGETVPKRSYKIKQGTASDVTLTAHWGNGMELTTSDLSSLEISANGKVLCNTVKKDAAFAIDEGEIVSFTCSYTDSSSRIFNITGVDTLYEGSYESDTTANASSLSDDKIYFFKMPKGKVELTLKNSTCITGDTLVNLANGKKKAVKDLNDQDELLTWNFFTGEYETQPASVIINHGKADYDVLKLKFSDDTELKIIGEHGLFDYDTNDFVSIDRNNYKQYIGHKFVSCNTKNNYKTVKLVSAKIEKEYVGAYSIASAYNLNLFAENILTIAPPVDVLSWIDMGSKMKYDTEKFNADLEKYGTYDYSFFSEFATEKQFNELNGKYYKIAIETGKVTLDEILLFAKTYLK